MKSMRSEAEIQRALTYAEEHASDDDQDYREMQTIIYVLEWTLGLNEDLSIE